MPQYAVVKTTFRDHQIANAQSRVDGFTEGSHINDRCIRFQTLQRREGLTREAELTVIVIFHNPTFMLARWQSVVYDVLNLSESLKGTDVKASQKSV
jgi:hypothetical protein